MRDQWGLLAPRCVDATLALVSPEPGFAKLSTVVAGVVGLSAGVAVAVVLSRLDADDASPRRPTTELAAGGAVPEVALGDDEVEGTEEARPTPEPRVADADATAAVAPSDDAPRVEGTSEAIADSTPAPDTATPDTAAPDTAAPDTAAPDTALPRGGVALEAEPRYRLVPGRFAYLRCDGAEQPGAAFPCPRDEAFEQGLVERARVLERCALPAGGALDLVVRIEEGVTELRTRNTFPSDTVVADEGVARSCLAGAFDGLAPTLHARRWFVSFRLVLEAR